MPRYFPLIKRVIVFVGGGATDVDYVDSFDMSDALSGTLGPVNAQDTIDAADMLVVSEFNANDTIDASDQMGAITDLDADDSVDITDALAGTLGPVNAIDSTDLTDALNLSDLDADDTIDISDAPSAPTLDADAADSIAISDQLGNLTTFDDDSLTISDALALTTEVSDDSLAVDDAFAAITGMMYADSTDLADIIATTTIDADTPDSFDVADALPAITGRFDDMLDISDNRSPVTFTGVLWPNTTVSNTGWTNPGNVIDTSTGTAATCAATSSGALGTGGTQNTTNCDIIISAGNPDLSDWDITDVTIDWQISAAQSGIPLTAGQCNINYQYSLNDGTNWTTFFAQTALNGSTSSLTLGALTETQVQQLRFRGVGAVLSGTGLLPVTTTASWNFVRATITASKTY